MISVYILKLLRQLRFEEPNVEQSEHVFYSKVYICSYYSLIERRKRQFTFTQLQKYRPWQHFLYELSTCSKKGHTY